MATTDGRRTRFDAVRIVEGDADQYERPPDGVIQIVGRHRPWAVSFLCPCGCDGLVILNLLRGASPRWSLQVEPDGRTVSILPSVNRFFSCGAHFFVQRNEVRWC